MKKYCALFILIILCGCSSQNDNVVTNKDINSFSVSDLSGAWQVVDSNPKDLNGMQLIINPNSNCVWSDKSGNTFSGPYYFFSNIKDSILKSQCKLVSSDTYDKIHINTIKINRYENSAPELYFMCDLLTLLPDKNWEYFSDKVNSTAWYFWIDNYFSYVFTISEYTSNKLVLKLKNSDVRFTDYKKDYPLAISDGQNITFIKK